VSLIVRQAGASVTLTGDLAAWAQESIRAATNGAVDEIQRVLEKVATAARSGWYGAAGVKRRTGKSGDIQVTTTLDYSAGIVRVSVGSTDKRTADPRSKSSKSVENAGKAVPLYVHRRGPLAFRPGDGKYLIPLFVNGPGRLAIKGALGRIGQAMATAVNNGG
jgi:hypothetical protein